VPFDPDHAVEHLDAAGWVFGALDPDDARAFARRLRSSRDCRALVREFAAVAEALGPPLPAVEPPLDLEAKTVAAVQYAVLAASRPAVAEHGAEHGAEPKASRWWHLH
jgi:anti-sigma-K factor RskA